MLRNGLWTAILRSKLLLDTILRPIKENPGEFLALVLTPSLLYSERAAFEAYYMAHARLAAEVFLTWFLSAFVALYTTWLVVERSSSPRFVFSRSLDKLKLHSLFVVWVFTMAYAAATVGFYNVQGFPDQSSAYNITKDFLYYGIFFMLVSVMLHLAGHVDHPAGPAPSAQQAVSALFLFLSAMAGVIGLVRMDAGFLSSSVFLELPSSSRSAIQWHVVLRDFSMFAWMGSTLVWTVCKTRFFGRLST